MAIRKKTVFIGQLQEGQQVQEVFLVAKKAVAETKAGKPYLALVLMDRTGEIEARIWDNALQFESRIEEGGFALVQGVARSFRDQMQLGVTGVQRVDESTVDMTDFMPASPRSMADMVAELEEVIAAIGDPPLRSLLQYIFSGETLDRFQRAPAAKKLHHAYLGGLIEHTLSVVGMAKKAAAHYPFIDPDMLVAGALLHDLAKIEEFDFSRPPFGYTDRGRLVGHLVLGVDLVRQAASRVEGIGADQIDRLLHIILSHHGQYGYGSPVLPMTPEAILLHHLDDIDAKMQFMDSQGRKMSGDGWQWTDYQRHLERYLYLRATGEDIDVDGSEPISTPDAQQPSAPMTASPSPAPNRQKQAVSHRQRTLF